MKFGVFAYFCEEKHLLLNALEHVYLEDEFISLNRGNISENIAQLDALFYFDIPSVLLEKYLKLPLEMIDSYKIDERNLLTNLCSAHKMELVILDEDTEKCVDFTSFYKKAYKEGKCNADDIASKMLAEIPADELENEYALVVDCDRTISINDVSADFLELVSVDTDIIGKVFAKTRYSMYQFYKIFTYYKDIDKEILEQGKEKILEKVVIKPEMHKILEDNKDILCIGISAGVLMAWQHVFKHKLPIKTLFGNSFEKGYLITPKVKEALVKLLQERGKKVIAIGDSIIDVPMLEQADTGYLVSYSFIGKGVENYLALQEKPKLKQLDFTVYPYDNVVKEEFTRIEA